MDGWDEGYRIGFAHGRAGAERQNQEDLEAAAEGYDRGYEDGERARDFAWKQALRETFREDLRRVRAAG